MDWYEGGTGPGVPGGELLLAAPGRQVLRVLTITRLIEVFECCRPAGIDGLQARRIDDHLQLALADLATLGVHHIVTAPLPDIRSLRHGSGIQHAPPRDLGTIPAPGSLMPATASLGHPRRGQADAAPGAPTLPRSLPVSLAIPDIGVRTNVIKLGLTPDHTLQVPPITPAGMQETGWYDLGPADLPAVAALGGLLSGVRAGRPCHGCEREDKGRRDPQHRPFSIRRYVASVSKEGPPPGGSGVFEAAPRISVLSESGSFRSLNRCF
jgi:hypothetical protein